MTRLRAILVPVIFGLLYAWDVWEALGNLVGLRPFYEAFGIGDAVPWALLWVGVTLPIIAFALALWVGRSLESLVERSAVLLLGWAVVAAVSLSIGSLEQAWRAAALQAGLG